MWVSISTSTNEEKKMLTIPIQDTINHLLEHYTKEQLAEKLADSTFVTEGLLRKINILNNEIKELKK